MKVYSDICIIILIARVYTIIYSIVYEYICL